VEVSERLVGSPTFKAGATRPQPYARVRWPGPAVRRRTSVFAAVRT
jgi:hypothetical protein